MRVLWSLPQAAPALLRHLGAYVEIAGQDLARTQRQWIAQAVACAILIVSAVFVLLIGCLAIVACTWDTPYRLSAIGWLGGGFVLVAIFAAVYRGNVARAQLPFLSSVRREWHEDRLILDRILADED